MKTFCANCGHAMTYEYKRLNFCTVCGTKMNGGAIASSPTPAPVSRPTPPRRYVEEEYEPEIPDFDQVAITASAKQGVKFGSVIGQGETGWVDRKKVSQKDFKEFTKRMTTTTKMDADDKG
jgi:hypothetical protein